MTKRIFRTVFVVAISIFIASAVLFMTVLYDYFSGIQQNQLRMQIDLASQGVEDEGLDYLKNLNIKDYRVTWIGTDGKVLYDSISEADEMENHFEREEVKEALSEGYGASSRYSSTLTQRYLYGAKRLPDGTVIRLSVTQNSLLILTLGMLQPIMIIFVIAIILSAFLASRLSKKIVKPLNELNLDKPLDNNGYDELSPLLRRIDTQQKEISRQSEELRQRQNELEVMTSAMSEGIILLNNRGTVLSINKAAAKLFGTDCFCIGEDIVSINRSLELAQLLNRAKNGEHSERVVELGCGRYQMMASPVISNNIVSGIVLLILDVTEKEKAEQLRREFTANVSHELKTPLHTISGSAELLANGMVKPEDIPIFLKRIYSETQRMIQLVEDIIRLSHLDEGAEDMKWDMVDLYAVAEETINSLADEAESNGIKFELYGETVLINGIRQLLQEIIYNLCDNAIKYNCRGGSVSVGVKNENEFAVLTITDTGIGIPAEHQERIFERFYRVDKSHSKEIGGTGLGLSIVKHAAKLHNAEIELHSIVNKGTEITIKFPKN
ncbi:PAS domain-containing sensor histidine kinase [Anaerotruncus sp. 80]|uniref:histidine kinase n=1 Tax=Anaerotruncus colihominis TaxID=169435 RepID=A0A845QLE5_9FIRM|nr:MULTISPECIES: ATP-binding protein [Clostridia]NBH61517.1 PAS domain-containing sensor histidine kinase [Anaerotruncus colihominis]NCF00014.1 PAS domain-containing sensor histidine kinase [Emergencia sp. 1XD21-10]NCF02172.1 PAS domain-containing sensor histidine kinase [Anaerotruncus sp. 80]